MSKISVILATYNEENNLRACLESIKSLASEIVIVDGSSTDKTVAIAKEFKAKVTIKDNPLMFHKNKQLAIEGATGDWILYLDADERVSTELKKEILKAIQESHYSGFWIPRKNIIFGKWIEHTGWWPDRQLRLFRQGKAFLPCQSVHEQPQLSGKAGYLENPLVHYNYQTVSQYLQKLNQLYTENDKRVFLAKKEKLSWTDFIKQPADEFLKRFFQEEGYKDGLHGLILSFFQAFSVLVCLAKVWEEQGFSTLEPPKFLLAINKEIDKVIKDFRYWIMTSLIGQTESKTKKTILKTRRKLKI
jgi:glycosyltransferase involved in cell wall biosynthesis